MRNIEPWCVSRQLWWGHRIPAWYGPKIGDGKTSPWTNYIDAEVFCYETQEEARQKIGEYYDGYRILYADTYEEASNLVIDEGQNDNTVVIWRDEDVLDTWFSSALWPFSTLGWPDETAELEKHYPTSTLITAHDIIFFWVARMMMMGLHFQKEVPFKDVYIHALVLDEKGQKMSKSKGNVIDPLKLIDAYGADALRFTMAAQAAQGRNIRLSESRVEGYRNFGTKLWNAARFCEMNECAADAAFDPAAVRSGVNQWIVHEANECVAAVTRELEAYRFNDAAGAIYKFTWNVFCDWYLELAKPALQGPDGEEKAETRAAAAWALGRILTLLHPFMPFITEELWGARGAAEKSLIVSEWPRHDAVLVNDDAAAEMNWVIDLIGAVRSVRQEMNVPVAAKIPLVFVGGDAAARARLDANTGVIERLARLSGVSLAEAAPKGAVQIVHGEAVAALPVADFIDIAAEKVRLEKEQAKAVKEIAGIDKKLGNKNFVERAPKEVVEEQHHRRAGYEAELEKLDAALERLKGL